MGIGASIQTSDRTARYAIDKFNPETFNLAHSHWLNIISVDFEARRTRTEGSSTSWHSNDDIFIDVVCTFLISRTRANIVAFVAQTLSWNVVLINNTERFTIPPIYTLSFCTKEMCTTLQKNLYSFHPVRKGILPAKI